MMMIFSLRTARRQLKNNGLKGHLNGVNWTSLSSLVVM
jgi:hypothetical protein